MEQQAVRVRVTGRVQGVGFRAFAKGEAAGRGVAGWVQNAPDGSVLAHCEGPPTAIEDLLAALRAGPPAARVEQVEAAPAAPQGSSGFAIRR